MQVPHQHSEIPEDYTFEGLDENFCRNPNSEKSTIWCYTTDPGMKWDFCYPVHEASDIQIPIEFGNFGLDFTSTHKIEHSSESLTGIENDRYYRGSQHYT